MQMLAVPTQDGIDLAIPPALAGLKAWIAIAAKTVFSRDEAAGLAGFVESPLPIGSEKSIGRFVVRKQLCLNPNGWIVFTFKTTDDGSALSDDSDEKLFNGKPISVWVETLSSEDRDERGAAIKQLAEIGKPAIPAVRSALRSRNPQVVVAACDVIGRTGQEAADAIPDLIVALKRDSEGFYGNGFTNVPTAAVFALKRIGKPSVKPLIEMMKVERGLLLTYIIPALAEIGEDAEEAIPGLIDVLRTRSTLYRTYAAGALGEFGDKAKAAVPDLIAALSDGHPPLRETAARALGRIGPDANEAIPQLRRLLDDDVKAVRETAAQAIANIEESDSRK